ncbi:hypothetical protein V9T40_006579 [Parthenolecanium corni]|uniref:Roadblock/LAMTOR2 domain-containing protein n=1 Tax=Parthenolecanium corni TaxID=536013 RepID=A0AAN9TZK5_9HEMI
MLTAKVLVNVLNKISSINGINDTVILSGTGEVLAYSGNDEKNIVDILSAITSNMWLMLQNSGETVLNEDNLSYVLIKCKGGRILIRRVAEFLLCIRADNTVGFGLLKKQSQLLEEYCQMPLNRAKNSLGNGRS